MEHKRSSTIPAMLAATVAITVTVLMFSVPAYGQRAPWERMEPARSLIAGAELRVDGIQIDLPTVTQDGSAVPLTVTVDHPMTEGHYIEKLHLFASGNPSPEVADFTFSPRAGQARVSTRVRLDGSQTVVALARTNRGEWLAGARDIRVTVSGCLNQAGTFEGDDFLRTRVRVPNRLRSGETAEVRTLINHPMETGLRQDSQGQKIPERILTRFEARISDELVIQAKFHRAIAANPYLLFHVAPGKSGALEMLWTEDTGQTTIAKAEIPTA